MEGPPIPPMGSNAGMPGVAFGSMDIDGHEQVEGMARHLLDSLETQGHSSGVDMRQVYDWAGQIVSRRRDLRREARSRWAALEPDQEPPTSPGQGVQSPVAMPSPAALGDQGIGDVERYLRSINRYRNEIREHQEGLNRDMSSMSKPADNLTEVPPDITALSGEEFEEDLEANIRRILQRATEELAGYTIKSMVSLEDLGPRTVATLRAALAEEFSSEADFLMEALVAQDFNMWLERLHVDHDVDEATLVDYHTAFDELQAEFKGVLSRDISVESVWRICVQLTGTDAFVEAIQKRASDMLNSIPGNKFHVPPPERRRTELQSQELSGYRHEAANSAGHSPEDRDFDGQALGTRLSMVEKDFDPDREVVATPVKNPMVPPQRQSTISGSVRNSKSGSEDSAANSGTDSNEAATAVQRGSFSANPLTVGQSMPDGPSVVDTSALERRLSQLRGEAEPAPAAAPPAQAQAKASAKLQDVTATPAARTPSKG
jgi:hypothetical protein